jgi:hypothetical protein
VTRCILVLVYTFNHFRPLDMYLFFNISHDITRWVTKCEMGTFHHLSWNKPHITWVINGVLFDVNLVNNHLFLLLISLLTMICAHMKCEGTWPSPLCNTTISGFQRHCKVHNYRKLVAKDEGPLCELEVTTSDISLHNCMNPVFPWEHFSWWGYGIVALHLYIHTFEWLYTCILNPQRFDG